jgi:hypothetical protein
MQPELFGCVASYRPPKLFEINFLVRNRKLAVKGFVVQIERGEYVPLKPQQRSAVPVFRGQKYALGRSQILSGKCKDLVFLIRSGRDIVPQPEKARGDSSVRYPISKSVVKENDVCECSRFPSAVEPSSPFLPHY